MTKIAEKLYLENSGDAGRWHSKNKPFSNHDCGLTLCSIGSIMALMPAAPARVLDLGCGSGWTSVFYAKHGYSVVGQDISADMISLASELRAENQLENRLTLAACDFEELPYSEEFDVAIFFDCLHHADDERAALKSAYRALKPGGLLITHEPGMGHSTTPESLAAIREFGVNERDMPPSLIIATGSDLGFKLRRVYPMQHDLHALFFRSREQKLFTKGGLKRALRILNLAFRPSRDNGAIVVMVKPT